MERKVTKIVKTKHGPNRIWPFLANLHAYPHYIGFVKRVEVFGSVKKGTKWYDVSTILFIPGKYIHYVERIKREEHIRFSIPLPFGGQMIEDVYLTPQKRGTRIEASVRFLLKPRPLDFVLGKILERRLHTMLETSIKNIQTLANLQ